MKSLSILCQKGGVGKTTIVVNIAKIYSNNGIKTLIIDLAHKVIRQLILILINKINQYLLHRILWKENWKKKSLFLVII